MRHAVAAFMVSMAALIGGARAHTTGTTAFAAITVQGQTVRYVLTLGAEAMQAVWTPPGGDVESLAGTVAQHVVVVANDTACVAVPGSVQPPSPTRPTIVVTVDYACAGRMQPLSLTDNLFDVLGPDHHTLATVEWPGGREQLVFEPDRREAHLALGAETVATPQSSTADSSSAESSPIAFFRLGVEHILTGYDHILFLLALILRGGSLGSLIGIVTAFTIAHSITLALAVLGVVVIPSWFVEPVIALSIAYVALENIFRRNAPSRRWAVSFVFGLVHGFGFAGALLELGLPPSGLVGSLLFFNLGVEAGQAMIVAVLFPILVWLCRFAWERRAVTAISVVVFVAAMALVIERVLFTEA
jgi:hydrogenase/urease accessory protein HupE